MKMRRILLLVFCVVIVIATVKCSESDVRQTGDLVDPVDDVDETDEDDPPPRPIRASASTSPSTPRKRIRGRKNGGGAARSTGVEAVQKRRLPVAFRPTRAPLFEASPPDPYSDSGLVGQNENHYGHSHSPPTRDPYYSPSRYEKEKRRHRIRLSNESPPPLVPLPQNSFDDPGPAILSTPGILPQQKPPPGKNYAFAYAVGDDAEDFSHKEKKDGAITVGEYRITLPDGRTQVVRYTAGGKHGYKADVTYEAPDPNAASSPSQPALHHHKQYHEPVQPIHHLSATPAPSYNTNRVVKSRPLKQVAVHEVEDDDEYHHQQSHEPEFHPPPHPSPKIRLKAGGNILTNPSPTSEYLNEISSTPTPRPNSIYDKISPFRGGKYSGSEELAYAHEQSPRAGPSRGKQKQFAKHVTSTAASFFESPSPSPYPVKSNTVVPTPTKKYKNYGQLPYVGHQSVNHVNEYARPQKHIQYLQETPVHHHHQPHHLQPHPTPIVTKAVKESHQHVVSLDNYKSGLMPESYSPPVYKSKKPKKLKHGIHNPLGQYLLQSPVTSQAPYAAYPQPTVAAIQPKDPYHYYNSFHSPHHHGYGQLHASPTPITSVTHSESPYPNAYPVTAFPTGPSLPSPTQPRLRLPVPPSTAGHVYLETPASGERPTRLGVQEALSRIPGRELSTPKTTIHPYEVGSADYGKGVAYGNSPQDKGYPETHYRTYGNSAIQNDNDDDHHLDHSNGLYNSVTSPATTGHGGHHDVGYYPHDVPEQFNFLNGIHNHNFDIEQANVREIRQPRPARVGGRLSRRANRRPDKRRGVPASTEPTKEDLQVTRPTAASPSSTRPTGRQRQRQQRQQVRTSQSRPVNPSRQPPPPSSTSRTPPRGGRRRRIRTTQPTSDPTSTIQNIESRRPRRRNRNNNRK